MSTSFVIAAVAVIAVILLIAVGIYNNLVRLRNSFGNAFAQIEVQLKRRYDLIPNLVEVAKGYLQHERETLEAVIQARNQASQAMDAARNNPGDGDALLGLSGAEGLLSGALGRLFALVESYPDLKADQNMRQLTEELTTTENKVAFARQAFNDAVMQYNNARQAFPAVLIAGMLGFADATFLEIEGEEHHEAPSVSFSDAGAQGGRS